MMYGEIAGAGGFAEILPHSVLVRVFGMECRVIDLETLIHAKRAAGRPKDFEVLAELELLRERRTAS
jgi:predicted nucleotidyltransferase